MPADPQVTKDSFRADLEHLVANFAANEAELTSPGYTEMQCRTQFITPFFRALGWDVENRAGKPYREMEVLEEKGPGEGRPDYTFRIGGVAKFFIEAKAPHQDLDSEHHVLQVKRYAWSTREVFAAVLTDFEELRFYDASLQPDPAHPHRGLIHNFRYTQYLTKVDELWELSRDRVAAGSIEALLPRDKLSLRFRKPVDDAFLADMTRWRTDLAKAVHKRNPALDDRALTDVVQRLLDRLIFIRVVEDRRIWEKYSLRERADLWESMGGRKPLLPMLNELFHQINDDFNGEIFRYHPCEEIQLDDPVLHRIIRELYPPRSPYAFDYISVDIFGAVYERYLGKTIQVRGKDVKVEDKPEVRKAGGVYYTPKFIVDYIVKHTVGKVIEGKSPKEIEKIKVLDPACGSGSFLLGAFECLIDYHVAWYEKHPKDAVTHPLYPELIPMGDASPNSELSSRAESRSSGRDAVEGPAFHIPATRGHRLSIHRKAKILSHNLFGVDLDPQAVEITMMNLYLKALEAERDLPHKQHLLPELNSNIRCGNSLIAPDIVDGIRSDDPERSRRVQRPSKGQELSPEDLERLRPFDWLSPADGFGDILKAGGFHAVIGNPPYDVLEKERGASSWPHTALSEYARRRKDYEAALGGKLNLFRFFIIKSIPLLREKGRLGVIVPLALLADISCAQTREHLLLSTRDLLADCFPQKDNRHRRVFLNAKLSTVVLTGSKDSTMGPDHAQIHVRVFPWNSFEDEYRESMVKFSDTKLIDPENTPIPLVDAKAWALCRTIHSSSHVVRLGEAKEFSVTRGEINQTIYRKYITTNPQMARLIKGVEVGQYQIRQRLHQGHREWLAEKRFLKHENEKLIVRQRRIATQRITGVDERLRVVATIIDPVAYFADSTNSVTVSAKSRYRLEYLLGILNSPLTQWRFKLTSTNNNVATNELESLPFRRIDFNNPSDAAWYEEIVSLVERVLKAKGDSKKSCTLIKRIDEIIYDLYGLTPAERKLVEAATQP